MVIELAPHRLYFYDLCMLTANGQEVDLPKSVCQEHSCPLNHISDIVNTKSYSCYHDNIIIAELTQ